jgi:hypothetical protein
VAGHRRGRGRHDPGGAERDPVFVCEEDLI